jgi:hypothetical protein
VRGVNPNDLGITQSGLDVSARAITYHRTKFENMFQAFRYGSVVCTTKFDVDLEGEIVAVLVASTMELACSNDLCDNSVLDISPLLDGNTKVL